MPRYSVHLEIDKYDYGLEAETTSRPTYAVGASSEEDAIKKAEAQAKEDYDTPKVRIKNIKIRKVNCYGTR